MGFKKIIAIAMTAGMIMSFVPASVMADSLGWHYSDGEWRYYTYEKGYITGDWYKISGKWYYFDGSGTMVSGVKNFTVDEREYDFDDSGACTNPQGRTPSSAGWYKKSYSNRNSVYDYETAVYAKEHPYGETWYYYDSYLNPVKGWKLIGGNWYYFGEFSGRMYSCTGGWPIFIDDQYYYFKDSGEMITGWYYDGKYWHYADSNGSLYYEDWLCSSGRWYYFDDASRMISGVENYTIDGVSYSFNSDGSCKNPYAGSDTKTITGWYKRCASYSYDVYYWYYYDSNGNRCTGWKQIDGKWYYFYEYTWDEDYYGVMSTGFDSIDGKQYYFNEGGDLAYGWIKITNPYNGRVNWYYAGEGGVIYRGKWLYDSGDWYYFDDEEHTMVSGVVDYEINGVKYSFDDSGVCINPDGDAVTHTGWVKNGYSWYYYDSDGEMIKDEWIQSGGNWYYLSEYGRMATGNNWWINDREYDFDSNGVCLNPYNGRTERQGQC